MYHFTLKFFNIHIFLNTSVYGDEVSSSKHWYLQPAKNYLQKQIKQEDKFMGGREFSWFVFLFWESC